MTGLAIFVLFFCIALLGLVLTSGTNPAFEPALVRLQEKLRPPLSRPNLETLQPEEVPSLGVYLYEDWRVRRLGIEGVLIEAVREGSGAARAGLRGTILAGGYIRRLGDVIIGINDQDVGSVNELKDALEPYKVGDQVRVTYVRERELRTATVRLQYFK